MAITYMTQEGYDKKMAELAHLENVERPEVVRAIVEARDKGDLSENAEYDAAKERQGMLEAKIAELKSLIASARRPTCARARFRSLPPSPRACWDTRWAKSLTYRHLPD